MLGKLIKHEFRATGRTMLPTLGILLLLSLLSSLSIRLLAAHDGQPVFIILTILFGILYYFGILAAWIFTFVTILIRFQRSMLGKEAYLTHTLPANLHSLLVSKLIVPCVWFLVLFVLTIGFVLFFVFNLLSLSNDGLRSLNWGELRGYMEALGITGARLWKLGLIFLLAAALGGISTCLQVYAAMSFGHMFSNNKALYSVLAYIGLQLIFQLISTVLMGALSMMPEDAIGMAVGMTPQMDSFGEALDIMTGISGYGMILTLLAGVALYLVTYFCQKKKLNLN